MNYDKFLDSLEPFEIDGLKAALVRRGGAGIHLTSGEITLIDQGRKLEAIKSVRFRAGIGLGEARALVEAAIKERQ